MSKGRQHTVKKLAQLSGVSIRTLHHYDRLGLLKPLQRTESRYRLYGEQELLRLQQILFYKELDFPLAEIKELLTDPEFDLLSALESHKEGLEKKKERLHLLLTTIDKTILKLKGRTTMKDEELYEGMSKETAAAYRKEAVEAYGEAAVKQSERSLLIRGKEDFQALQRQHEEIRNQLRAHRHFSPESTEVQQLILRHYKIIRQFWGTSDLADLQAEAYKGLGLLYVSDQRFMAKDGQPDPDFASFVSNAMTWFAEKELR